MPWYGEEIPHIPCASHKGKQLWEVGGEDLPMSVSVKGRLQSNVEFWRDVLHTPPAVL